MYQKKALERHGAKNISNVRGGMKVRGDNQTARLSRV